MSTPPVNDAFVLPIVAAPTALISPERVKGAGVLLLARIYGDQLRFFDAIDKARELLDTDLLCLDTLKNVSCSTNPQQTLLNLLYRWPETGHQVSLATRQRLANKVLGIPAPGAPAAERDTLIQPLLSRLLDSINAVPDPTSLKSADQEVLKLTAQLVEARLSTTMTGLVTMQVRDLQKQLGVATSILGDLGGHLKRPCRPGATDEYNVFAPLTVLVGKQLEADGVDLFQTADIAEAWRVVFEKLPNLTGSVTQVDDQLSRAAAVLRPPGTDRLPVYLSAGTQAPVG